MTDAVLTMTTDELTERVAMYDRQNNLSTSDWVNYQAHVNELRRRDGLGCEACGGSGRVPLADGRWFRCVICNQKKGA